MEEDIKILEEKVNKWNEYRKNNRFSTGGIEDELDKENQAIEHLIARNRELENKVKSLIEVIKINERLYDKETARLGNIIGELLGEED